MSDTVIKVENVSKMYRLGVINSGTLRQDIQSWMARKLGKVDPNSKIGDEKYEGDKDHFWALKNVTFEVKQGDRLGIIGKNGAGKSTILKLLSRISSPTEGIIKIKGKVASLLEVGTGFHGELTGRENIYLNGTILGMNKRTIDERLDSIIDFSGIERHIDTPVKRYSSGMFVRLAFAVAAHLDSDILIADEVLAVGDAEFQKKALGKMEDLSTKQGRTILFVSHNLGAVKRLCNLGILLLNGKMIENDHIDNVICQYDHSTSNIMVENNSNNDYKTRRGAGDIHFTSVELSKKKYYSSDDININFCIEATAELHKIYFQLLIKHENSEPLTIICHNLVNEDVPKGFIKNYCLKIPGFTFRPGRYPVYLWLGDEQALTQGGDPTNYDVLDEYIQPIVIELSEEEKQSIFRNSLSSGQININTELTSL